MFLELDNHTGRELAVSQAWLGLPGSRVNRATKKPVFMGDMAGGVIYNGRLPPGKTIANQHGVFECGLANLGLPPAEGCQIDLIVKADVRLDDGRFFSTPGEGVRLGFSWRYPNAQEMKVMKLRFVELLAHPTFEFGHGYRLRSLACVEPVADAPSFEELLAARGSRQNSVDGRDSVIEVLVRRFGDDPRLVQLYEGELRQRKAAAVDDLLAAPLWNRAWVAPLVALFQKSGQGALIRILASHRSDWATNEGYIGDLAAGLLRHRPLLRTNVTALGAGELIGWCQAAHEAGLVGARTLIPVLRPGLDDKRVARHPDEAHLAYTPPRQRVCDAALHAILTILDGSPTPAMMQAENELPAESAATNSNAVADFSIIGLERRLERDDSPTRNR